MTLLWFLLFAVQSSPVPPQSSGLTIATTVTTSTSDLRFSSETTIYMQHDRKRTEFLDTSVGKSSAGSSSHRAPLVSIRRCDLQQFYRLNMDAHEYQVQSTNPRMQGSFQALPAASMPGSPYDMPKMRVVTTTKDTGERKEMFGHGKTRDHNHRIGSVQ